MTGLWPFIHMHLPHLPFHFVPSKGFFKDLAKISYMTFLWKGLCLYMLYSSGVSPHTFPHWDTFLNLAKTPSMRHIDGNICDHFLKLYTSAVRSPLFKKGRHIFLILVETLHVTYYLKVLWQLIHVLNFSRNSPELCPYKGVFVNLAKNFHVI